MICIQSLSSFVLAKTEEYHTISGWTVGGHGILIFVFTEEFSYASEEYLGVLVFCSKPVKSPHVIVSHILSLNNN